MSISLPMSSGVSYALSGSFFSFFAANLSRRALVRVVVLCVVLTIVSCFVGAVDPARFGNFLPIFALPVLGICWYVGLYESPEEDDDDDEDEGGDEDNIGGDGCFRLELSRCSSLDGDFISLRGDVCSISDIVEVSAVFVTVGVGGNLQLVLLSSRMAWRQY